MAEPRKYGSNITLPPLADLFSTQQERDDAALEKVQIIALAELHEFPNHPFSVRNDEDMDKLCESIKENGVLMPAIARPRAEGGYELISGHRRRRGSELAGLDTMPVIIRDMSDDEAVILMVDSNVQRENILPTEKAKAYKMKMDAIKRSGGRPFKNNASQVGTHYLKGRSDQILAEDVTDSKSQIQRYIRLNDLIPELQKMVDDRHIKFNPAVELSYLTKEEQEEFYQYIDSEECTPSLSQAQKLKAASKDHTFSANQLKEIMTAPPKIVKSQQITLPFDRIAKFFPQSMTAEQIANKILAMLEAQARAHRRNNLGR